MNLVENTTYSGVGKDFGYCPYEVTYQPVDYRGRRIFKGEEYYIFDVESGVIYVHIEDVQDYLNDDRLDVECYDQLIRLIEVYHDNYPIIM